MKTGEQIVTQTNNLFTNFIVGLNENGHLVEIPINSRGTITEIKDKSKNGYTIGVDFKFRNNLGSEQQITIFLQPRNICKIKFDN